MPQEEYSRINAEFRASQAQVTASQSDYSKADAQRVNLHAQVEELQSEYNAAYAQLATSQAQVVDLQWQLDQLNKQPELTGETPTITAQNIVTWYHKNHLYSETDSFVCSDMALDVWDMLKAQGIHALIELGNAEKPVHNITDCNHVWVLAEVSPGKYLALETIWGYIVWEKDNPLYYRGWSFDNPKEYKESTAGGGHTLIEFPDTPSYVPGVN